MRMPRALARAEESLSVWIVRRQASRGSEIEEELHRSLANSDVKRAVDGARAFNVICCMNPTAPRLKVTLK